MGRATASPTFVPSHIVHVWYPMKCSFLKIVPEHCKSPCPTETEYSIITTSSIFRSSTTLYHFFFRYLKALCFLVYSNSNFLVQHWLAKSMPSYPPSHSPSLFIPSPVNIVASTEHMFATPLCQLQLVPVTFFSIIATVSNPVKTSITSRALLCSTFFPSPNDWLKAFP